MPIRLFRKKPAIRRNMRRGRPGMIKRVPRGIPNVYRFKRLVSPVRIYHLPADPQGTWRIEDPGVTMNPAFLSGAAWPAETLTGTNQNQFGVRHALNQVAQATDFTNLYDRYKITGVKVTFLYQVSDAGSTGAGVLPTILYSTDYDDAAAPTYAALRAKQNAKQRILTANRPFSIFYRPKMVTVAQESNGTTFNPSMVTSGYINSSFPQVDHYGLKFSLNNLYSSVGTAAQLEIKYVYYLAMKDPQ